jgi:hypothetical protein
MLAPDSHQCLGDGLAGSEIDNFAADAGQWRQSDREAKIHPWAKLNSGNLKTRKSVAIDGDGVDAGRKQRDKETSFGIGIDVPFKAGAFIGRRHLRVGHSGTVGIGHRSRKVRECLPILRARRNTHEQHADYDQELTCDAANFSFSCQHGSLLAVKTLFI